MPHRPLSNYLRSHRKKNDLSQLELANLLGYDSMDPVGRHENGVSVPPLSIALAYEVIFRVPISKLFPGYYRTVAQDIEARLAELEEALEKKSASDRDAKVTARKLEFLHARRLDNET